MNDRNMIEKIKNLTGYEHKRGSECRLGSARKPRGCGTEGKNCQSPNSEQHKHCAIITNLKVIKYILLTRVIN